MKRDDRAYLNHILNSISKIEEFTDDMDEEEFKTKDIREDEDFEPSDKFIAIPIKDCMFRSKKTVRSCENHKRY